MTVHPKSDDRRDSIRGNSDTLIRPERRPSLRSSAALDTFPEQTILTPSRRLDRGALRISGMDGPHAWP